MPSTSYTDYLETLLADAKELDDGHRQLRTGSKGRQWRLGALNRAAVVMCVSAWEAYVEEVIKEALDALRPASPPTGVWAALNASARSQIGRFNTPNSQGVRMLLSDCIGLQNVTSAWSWKNCTPADARRRLDDMLTLRHEVAHGVKPRPTVHNMYSKRLPSFVRNLGQCTDVAIRQHLSHFGATVSW